MYTFSSKLKSFSIILMALGLLGIGYGFFTAPKDIQEVEKILASESHGEHGEVKHEVTTDGAEAHEVVASHKGVKESAETAEPNMVEESHDEVKGAVAATETHEGVISHGLRFCLE